jgi:hypothetical protein
VLAAVDFDDQACVVANEIGDILPEWHVLPEAMADPKGSQDLPNAPLGIRHVPPQNSRTVMRTVRGKSFHGSPIVSGTPSRTLHQGFTKHG